MISFLVNTNTFLEVQTLNPDLKSATISLFVFLLVEQLCLSCPYSLRCLRGEEGGRELIFAAGLLRGLQMRMDIRLFLVEWISFMVWYKEQVITICGLHEQNYKYGAINVKVNPNKERKVNRTYLVRMKLQDQIQIQNTYNNTAMSRLATQPDIDPFTQKLSIIASNMSRITSQNKRLQELLNHQTHLDRLREISDGSAMNWQKLANLAENVQELSLQAKTSRERLHSSLNRHTEMINKTLLADIQGARSTLAGFEARLNHLKNRERKFMISEFQRQRQVVNERVQAKVSEAVGFVSKLGEKYEQQTLNKLKDMIANGKQDLHQKYIQCRINLGHLHNVVSYYHWKKTSDSLTDHRPHEISSSTITNINNKMEGIEFNLKRIKGEVDWMRARQKRNKGVSIKQERRTTQHYEPMEEGRGQQVGMSVEQVDYQLKGLERILDYQTIIRTIRLEDINIEELNGVRMRVRAMREKQQNYTNFYKLKI